MERLYHSLLVRLIRNLNNLCSDDGVLDRGDGGDMYCCLYHLLPPLRDEVQLKVPIPHWPGSVKGGM